MNYKFLCLLIGFSIIMLTAYSQDTPNKYYGIDAGITFLGGKMTNMDYVRGDIPYYPTGESTQNLRSMTFKSFVGLRTELLLHEDKFGISTGLRYSRINSTVGKNTYWNNSTNYFYVLYRQDGLNTEYLKVREISQKSDYIGIPVELRYFPTDPHLVRIYFKVGAEVSVRVHTKTDVTFADDAMDLYHNEISALVGEPGPVNSSVFGALGFRIGKGIRSYVNLEICLPTVFLTEETSGLVNPASGGGFQLSYQLPYKTKVK